MRKYQEVNKKNNKEIIRSDYKKLIISQQAGYGCSQEVKKDVIRSLIRK